MFFINIYMRFDANKIIPIVKKMNAETKKFMEDLEEIKATHPNIYKIWTAYIETRVLHLANAVEKGRVMLAASQRIPDIPREDILLLLAFSDT